MDKALALYQWLASEPQAYAIYAAMLLCICYVTALIADRVRAWGLRLVNESGQWDIRKKQRRAAAHQFSRSDAATS